MSIFAAQAIGVRNGVYGGTAATLSNAATLFEVGAYTLTDIVATNPDPTNSAWVNVYDAATAGAVTVGTTTPVFQFAVPANATVVAVPTGGKTIANGIVLAAATTNSGSTAPVTALNVGFAIL